MKKTCLFLFAVLLLLNFTSCQCDHIYTEATCQTPKTCEKCGETVGKALECEYSDPTCEKPGICKWCNGTNGTALGHDFTEANCFSPMTCRRCNKTEGERLSHIYKSGICSICQSKDPNFIDLNEVGFTNRHGYDAWIMVADYNLEEGYVELNQSLECVKFSNGYFDHGILYIISDSISSALGTMIGIEGFELSEEAAQELSDNSRNFKNGSHDFLLSLKRSPAYTLLENDVMKYEGNDTATITDRVVDNEKGYIIVKVKRIKRIFNYVPVDLIDWSRAIKEEDPDKLYFIQQ